VTIDPPDVPTGPSNPSSDDTRIFIDDHVAYIIGYPDGTVCPQRDITRAEVATVFFRLITDDLRSANWTRSNLYSDVSVDDWYNNAVSVMSKIGIINGYPEGTFNPDSSITRAEMAAMAARFARKMNMAKTNNASFSDIAEHWAEADILCAAEIGWVNGYLDGTYKPDQPITRAEFMNLVNKMLKRVPEGKDDLMTDVMTKWQDNADLDAWYYLAVQEATNSHEPKFKNKIVPSLLFNYEYWVKLIPNRDWAQLEQTWSTGVLR